MRHKNLTTYIFVERSISKHGVIYDYSLVDYINNSTKVKIICPCHGLFEQRPANHMRGEGCYQCGHVKTNNKQTTTLEDFIISAKTIHPNLYEYSSVVYVNARTTVIILCPSHGPFTQTPDNHLHGKGCSACAKNIIERYRQPRAKKFIDSASRKHNNYYLYNNTVYNGMRTKLLVTCPIHGDFSITPDNHLRGRGCPTCNTSRGETKVEAILLKLGITFIRQAKFKDCKLKRELPFDFAIIGPSKNILGVIEFQGIQHFEPVYIWKGAAGLIDIQFRDKIKKEYCKSNNIPFLALNHNETKLMFENITSFIKEL